MLFRDELDQSIVYCCAFLFIKYQLQIYILPLAYLVVNVWF